MAIKTHLRSDKMELLAVGTLAFDTVETPFGKAEDTLGGSLTFVSTAASYFTKPAIVGVVGEDFSEDYITAFESRGIDTSGIEKRPGKTFRWGGKYKTDINERDTTFTDLNVLGDFDPQIDEKFKNARVLALGNVDPSIQLKVLDRAGDVGLVALDTMDFWIKGTPDALREVLKRSDFVMINDSEARLLSGEYHLPLAAKKIIEMGPTNLVIQRGEYVAVLFTPTTTFAAPALILDTVIDPTGAGDAFAGGMLGYLASIGKYDDESMRQALVMGIIMASFAVEDFSTARFDTIDADLIKTRIKQFEDLTRFEMPQPKIRID